MPVVAVDPTGHTTAVEWLFVIVPVLALLGVATSLVVRGEAAEHRGLAAPLARAASELRRISGLPAWCIGGVWMSLWALLVAGLGFYWDVAWHIDLGRDRQLFTVPHTLIILGLFGIVVAALVSIALATVERAQTGWRAGRLRVPYAAVPLLACGLGACAGFPLDDLWHRNYGIDVTMWGPTHLMMIGGGALAPMAVWLLYAEAGHEGGRPRVRKDLRRQLAGTLLLSLSVYQLEFDLGVPQWQALYQPVLIALACGAGMVTARVAFGRGWALLVAVNFVVSRSVVALVVGPGLGHTMPHYPLYVGSALAVEAVFWLGERRGARALGLAVAAGLAVGTAGLATEWGFSHLWGLQPWQPSLFPGIWAATAVAVAGAVVGTAMGTVLSHRPSSLPRPAVVAALIAVAGLLVVPMPRNGAAIAAEMRTSPAGPARLAIDRDGNASVESAIGVDLYMRPTASADGADIFRITSWQGGSLHISPLVEIGPGHWRSRDSVPVGGTWKSLLFLNRRDVVVAAPVSFPADRLYNQPAVAVQPQRSVDFVPASRWLMREVHGGPAWPAVLAYCGLLGVVMMWVLMLALAYVRVGRKVGGPPPAHPIEVQGRREPAARAVAGLAAR